MKPPDHLSAAGKALYTTVTDGWELHDGELKILVSVCELEGTLTSIRNRLRKDGLMIKDSKGRDIPHPLLSTHRQTVRVQADLLGKLKLEIEEDPEPTQPTRVRLGNKGGRPSGSKPYTPKPKAAV